MATTNLTANIATSEKADMARENFVGGGEQLGHFEEQYCLHGDDG